MRKQKKIVLWMIGSVFLLLLLTGGFVLFLPHLVDMKPIRERILLKLSQEVGGQVTYGSLDLSYFPRPRVIIREASLSVPGIVTGKLNSVEIFPALLALFRGKLHISRFLVVSPEFRLNIPEATKKTGKTTAPGPMEETGRILSEISAVIASNLPDLTVIIKDGRLDLQRKSKPSLSFSAINGRLTGPPGDFQVDMSCGSNLWERMWVKATIDPVALKGHGHIETASFHPHLLSDFLSPDFPLKVTDSELNLNLSFETKGQGVLQAAIEGSVSKLTFEEGSQETTIRGKGFRVAFQMEGERIDISLGELNLEYPRLTLSGRFKIDQKAPHLLIEVQGKEMDVTSTREATLRLAGKIPVMKTIFNIVREGRIPLITFHSYGRRMSDLDDTERFSIKGNILDGKISIPVGEPGGDREDFTLVKAAGDVVISRGILEGKNLRAQWKNQQLQEGRVRVGLEGKDAPLHLEVIAEMDLASLPPLLGRLIKEETLLRELSRIHDLKGRAVGKIVLGESTASLKTKVEISEMNFMAHYDPIPYPVEIDQGQFSFDGERIGLKGLSGKVGRSTFSGFTANLGIGKKQEIEIFSGASSLVLEDILLRHSFVEAVKSVLKDIPSLKGGLRLNTVKLAGPISSPGDWRFEVAGELRDVEVKASSLPGPITISSGKFRATQKKFSFDNFQTKLLDASFNLEGSLDSYLQGIEKVDLNIRGSMTPKDIHQLSNLFGLKSKIPVRSPLSISEGHLSWMKAGDTSFKGNIAFKEGPQISLDVFQGTDRLKVNRLRINDGPSQVDMTFELQGRTLGVTFSGELSERTLDRIFEGYQFQNGWLKGDFRATLLMDQLTRSTVQGKLEAKDLSVPWQLEKPLKIDHISLRGDGNHMSIGDARFAWGEMPFVLSGDVSFSEKSVLLDVDLSTGSVDLDQVIKSRRKGKNGKGAQDLSNLQVEGTIRFKSNSLKYGRFTWAPFRADIAVGQNVVEVKVEEAKLCGISTPGVVKVKDQEVSLDVRPVSRSRELEATVKCLLDQEIRATGNFDFRGRIFAQGKPEDLMNTLRGDVEFQAKDGRVDYMVWLARILEFVNLTEVYRGKIPDMEKEGLSYKLFTVIGSLEDGKFIIKEAKLDGHSLQLAAQGEVYLAEGNVNLTVLVAPLRTVDRIINLIPLVRYILAGTLVAIPVRVSGDLKDPKVNPISLSGVGSELLAMMKRTLGLPLKLVEPLMPRKKEESGEER